MSKYVCQDCGDTVTEDPGHDPWQCVVCGGHVVEAGESEVTPNSELRELVDQWRERQEWYFERARTEGSPEASGNAKAFKQCADELEELIDDE